VKLVGVLGRYSAKSILQRSLEKVMCRCKGEAELILGGIVHVESGGSAI